MIAAAVLAALTFLSQSAPPTSEPIPEGYVPLIDSTSAIVLAVPAAWEDVDIAPVPVEDGSEFPYIAASPDLAAFYESFTVPGVLYAGFPLTENLLALVDTFGPRRDCVSMEVKEYEDPYFLGVIQIGLDCGPEHMTWNMVVANHKGAPFFTAMVQIQSADDVERTTILRTFNVGPGAPTIFVTTTTAPTTTVVPTTAAVTTTT